MRFRPKRGDVNAIQWTGQNVDEIRALVAHSNGRPGTVCDVGDGFLTVGSGVLRLRDWLVEGVDRQLVSLRPDIFERMFEPVVEETSHHLEPGGDVSMPAAFMHCPRCGHYCNSCGACRTCAPAHSRGRTLIGKALTLVFRHKGTGHRRVA